MLGANYKVLAVPVLKAGVHSIPSLWEPRAWKHGEGGVSAEVTANELGLSFMSHMS